VDGLSWPHTGKDTPPDQYKINGNEWYNYNDPACKDWSNVCSGTYKISNIKVTAEAEL
jgi:hypothetical protein